MIPDQLFNKAFHKGELCGWPACYHHTHSLAHQLNSHPIRFCREISHRPAEVQNRCLHLMPDKVVSDGDGSSHCWEEMCHCSAIVFFILHLVRGCSHLWQIVSARLLKFSSSPNIKINLFPLTCCCCWLSLKHKNKDECAVICFLCNCNELKIKCSF